MASRRTDRDRSGHRRSPAPSSTSSSRAGQLPAIFNAVEIERDRRRFAHLRGPAAPRQQLGALRRHDHHRRPGARHRRPSTPARRSRCRSARRRSAASSTSSASPIDDKGPVEAETALPDPPRRRPRSTSRPPRSRSSRRASRSSTSSARSRRAARSASSAAPASARPSSSRSSSATSPRSTAATRCSPASASALREGNDLLARDDRVGRPRQDRHGVRPDERAARRPPARRPDRPDDGGVLPRRGGRDVLLFIDNIFRFTQAGSEVSALLGRMPSAVGYQPNLATEMAGLQERITSTKTGSITSLQAVFVPADDYTDPAPATTFAHLDATIRLERYLDRAGHLPRGRPAHLDLAGPRPERRRAGALRRRARGPAGPAALPRPAGHHRDPGHRRAVRGGQARPSPGRAACSGSWPAVLRGRGVHRPRRASTCRSRTRSRRFKEILEGKADDLPEQAFFLAGTLDDVRENAAKLAVAVDPEAGRRAMATTGGPRCRSSSRS